MTNDLHIGTVGEFYDTHPINEQQILDKLRSDDVDLSTITEDKQRLIMPVRLEVIKLGLVTKRRHVRYKSCLTHQIHPLGYKIPTCIALGKQHCSAAQLWRVPVLFAITSHQDEGITLGPLALQKPFTHFKPQHPVVECPANLYQWSE